MLALRRINSFKPLARLSTQTILRTFSSNLDSSDKDLQLSFEGLYPRLVALQGLLNESGRNYYELLVETEVTSRTRPFSSLYLYADLQNPLLQKYDFDPMDFMDGAKEAFKQIHHAIASEEFFNYANDKIETSSQAELLKESVSPTIYDACLSALQSLGAQGSKTFMTDVKILEIAMTSVNTYVVDQARLKKLNYAKLNKYLKKEIDKFSESVDKGEIGYGKFMEKTITLAADVPESEILEDPGYPLGSVVATVEVHFKAEESYETKADGQVIPSKKTSYSSWMFEACISEQVEMDWKIISFGSSPYMY